MIKTVLIGCGEWGYNLFRNLMNNDDICLVAVCDPSQESIRKITKPYPKIKPYTTVKETLTECKDVEAVVIASPAATHEDIACRCIQRGLHVLIEKPMATSVAGAERISSEAEKKNVTVMIGHTFLYNPAVRALKEYLEKGTIGDIYYLYSRRLNLGRIRRDTTAMWNFAPHDVSIMLYLTSSFPVAVNAKGWSFLQEGIEDVVFMTLEFPNNIAAHIHVSWLDPNKVREMTVVGSRKMIVYDDVSYEAKLKIYDKAAVSSKGRSFKDFGEFQLASHSGDLLIPRIQFVEPLSIEVAHFIECIKTGKKPLTGIENGLQVVRILDAAQKSIAQGGTAVSLRK